MMQLAIAPLLLLISAAPPPAPSLVMLVLRDGSRIEAAGRIERQGSRITFRNRAGVLYSIPESEVDREISVDQGAWSNATIFVTPGEAHVPVEKPPSLTEVARPRLNDKERLLHEIEQNHSGVAAPPQAREEPLPPMESGTATLRNPEEWTWRREARSYQEAVRRAEEDLAMLEGRERKLQDEILTLTSFGYRARQLSYQISELGRVREQLEPARLDLARARQPQELPALMEALQGVAKRFENLGSETTRLSATISGVHAAV